MNFLIEYDRPSGKLIQMTGFKDSDKHSAEVARLNLELERSDQGIEREIVILEAVSEEAVRRTHRRYFETLAELITEFAS